MLFLVFHIGDERYALETTQVVEVLPLVEMKVMPQAPRGVIGAFNYRGVPVPVLDISELALGRPSRLLMSTRVIVLNYVETGGTEHLLGLVAERATDTIRREPSDFVDAGVAIDAAPYLGPVTLDKAGMIQRIEVGQLLPEATRDILFREPMHVA